MRAQSIITDADFSIEAESRPASIGRIDHYIDDPDGTNATRRMVFMLDILDQNGNRKTRRSGNEAPHLTTTQRNNLIAFLDSRRSALPAQLGLAAGHTIGRIIYRIRDLDGTTPGKSIHVRAVELDEAGRFVRGHQLNDGANLTTAQRNALITFLDTQRGKATTAIIGQ